MESSELKEIREEVDEKINKTFKKILKIYNKYYKQSKCEKYSDCIGLSYCEGISYLCDIGNGSSFCGFRPLARSLVKKYKNEVSNVLRQCHSLINKCVINYSRFDPFAVMDCPSDYYPVCIKNHCTIRYMTGNDPISPEEYYNEYSPNMEKRGFCPVN